jgi:hypothetical protein
MKTEISYILFFFILVFSHINAQPVLPGQGTGGGNVEDTPITLLIYPIMALGLYMGIRYFKK